MTVLLDWAQEGENPASLFQQMCKIPFPPKENPNETKQNIKTGIQTSFYNQKP